MAEIIDNLTLENGWKPAFMAALHQDPNVTQAARAAGVSRQAAYQARHADPEFASAWDDAIEASTDDLETEARRRAKDSSDTLMIFLLKAHRPEKYRERTSTELTGKDGGPIELSDAKSTLLRGLVPDAPAE